MAESRAMSSICVNCLSRLRISTLTPATHLSPVRSFHNTPTALANVVKKRPQQNAGVRVHGHREQRSATIKKKRRERPSLPAVGERKAMRKRIVLSNTNALPVESMQDLNTENMADPQFEAHMLGLPGLDTRGGLLDQLRAVEAFKTSQNWSMFRRPGTLMRKETIEIGKMLKELNEKQGVQRGIVDGPKESGKSLILLQAMSMAFLNNWVVVNIPEAQEFTISHSSYRPLPPTAEGQQLYEQPQLTAALLRRIAEANRKVLSGLTLAHEHPDFPEPLQKNMSLDRLADRGASNPSQAVTVFNALWKELTVPAADAPQPRPPILVSVDSLNHLMTESTYRAADFSLVHPHQFTLIRHFLSLLFGKNEAKLGPAGGMVLAATSGSNVPGTATLDLALKQLRARTSTPPVSADSPDFPLGDPYMKLDKRVIEMFETDGLRLHNINGLSKTEAKGLLEYFARSGLMRDKVTDDLVAEKWSLSAGGLVGYVQKAAVRITA